MIDTDKYEGHNAPWKVIEYIDAISAVGELNTADAQLISDAPKLLAEVKRLRGIAKTCLEAIEVGGDIRSGTIEVIEHNLKVMIE